MKKSIRGKSLGENYDKAALEKRIVETLALKEERLKAEQEAMREVAEEQNVTEITKEEVVEDVLEKSVMVEDSAEKMDELAELQSRFICLQYEFQYNLDKISDLDYEHRYKNPEHYIEGIVFWKDGEPRCKIKRSDFGLEWNCGERKG